MKKKFWPAVPRVRGWFFGTDMIQICTKSVVDLNKKHQIDRICEISNATVTFHLNNEKRRRKPTRISEFEIVFPETPVIVFPETQNFLLVSLASFSLFGFVGARVIFLINQLRPQIEKLPLWRGAGGGGVLAGTRPPSAAGDGVPPSLQIPTHTHTPRTVPCNCICRCSRMRARLSPPASSSFAHARRMDGFCNQNADQLGSLAGPSLLTVYVVEDM
jgi:hypothetical protein